MDNAKLALIHPELPVTNPDYVLYVPKGKDSGALDGNNAGLTVLPGLTDQELLAFWMQDTAEQAPDTRYVFSRSLDGGVSWTEPIVISGLDYDRTTGFNRCCFGTALRNASGRIYVLMGRSSGHMDPHENGFLFVMYSDDNAQSFSTPVQIPLEKFPEYDNDDPEIPPTWIPYQPPLRLKSGAYVGGISRYCSYQKFPQRDHWTDEESVSSMYLIENADDNPEPADLIIRWTGHLTAPSRHNPAWNVGQEPAVVELPDGRLFCVFRTNSGSPWYAISPDGGYSWNAPEVLRYGDNLPPVLHPLSPCPIYAGDEGEFFLFIHNHDGHFGPFNEYDTFAHRRPIYLVRGTFTPEAHQPITFGTPEFFFDDDGVPLGYTTMRQDLAIYGSMTHINGKHILWYPDRKHFLLGKVIGKKRG